ncbi:prolyl oligopeptidase family serine peptidase [Chelativorans xinjiangense]|uniref:alpha/beta hydrolase family protein n=1 Tax=Chelativorans xinjiangense TaxID=2681485 RepID=UPI00135A3A9F
MRAFAERSPIYHAENIRAETLILHGRLDDRVPVRQAEMFAAAVRRGGAVTSLKLFDCGHNIPLPQRRETLRPLYDRVFS